MSSSIDIRGSLVTIFSSLFAFAVSVMPLTVLAASVHTSTFAVQQYSGTNVANDGWTAVGGPDWAGVRSAPIGQQAINSDAGFDRVIGALWLGNYYVQRLHLSFDTSSLPKNAVIDGANLVLTVADGNFAASTSGLYVVGSSQSDQYVTTATYAQVGDVDYGHMMVPMAGTYEIPLKRVALKEVSASGITRFAVRTWHDFNDVAPAHEVGDHLDGDDFYIVSGEGPAGDAPRLVVMWHKGKAESHEKHVKDEKEHH